jgi:hypothetical protein
MIKRDDWKEVVKPMPVDSWRLYFRSFVIDLDTVIGNSIICQLCKLKTPSTKERKINVNDHGSYDSNNKDNNSTIR